MGSGTIAFVLLTACATVNAIVFTESAKPSVYNELVCQLADGSGGLCRAASDCPSASSAQPCVARGLVCCPSTASPPPAAGVGVKSRQECEKSAQFATFTECPAIEMIPKQNVAVPGLFPYLAVLAYGNLSDFKGCNGVLVSESYVLTLARCAKLPQDPDAILSRVRLGDVDLTMSDGDEAVQEIYVDKVIIHPLYQPRISYHDLALLHLRTPAKLSSRVRPACLNSLAQLPTNHVIVAGFGTQDSERKKFGTAHYVDLTEIPALQCAKAFPQHASLGIVLDKSVICATDEAGGRGACVGDSGGSLQVRLDKPHCQFSVAGITSLGSHDCWGPGATSVFTSVAEYLPWIESIVWP